MVEEQIGYLKKFLYDKLIAKDYGHINRKLDELQCFFYENLNKEEEQEDLK